MFFFSLQRQFYLMKYSSWHLDTYEYRMFKRDFFSSFWVFRILFCVIIQLTVFLCMLLLKVFIIHGQNIPAWYWRVLEIIFFFFADWVINIIHFSVKFLVIVFFYDYQYDLDCAVQSYHVFRTLHGPNARNKTSERGISLTSALRSTEWKIVYLQNMTNNHIYTHTPRCNWSNSEKSFWYKEIYLKSKYELYSLLQ